MDLVLRFPALKEASESYNSARLPGLKEVHVSELARGFDSRVGLAGLCEVESVGVSESDSNG